MLMRKRRIAGIALGVICFAGGAIGLAWRTYWRCPQEYPQACFDAAEALRLVQVGAPRQPVPQKLLTLNAKRAAIGLREIGADWAVAPTRYMVFDGPDAHVLVDGHGMPAKVIFGESGFREYEVRDGRVSGLAAMWVTGKLVLERTETYRDERLVSADYYCPEGQVIASCTFRCGKPWNGRYLQRYDPWFSHGGFDVSYNNGKINGQEWEYGKGKRPVRMLTYRDGVLNGPARFYYDDGKLLHEYSYVDGVARRHRSWHHNGQLHFEIEFNSHGQHIGPSHWYDPNGKGRLLPASDPARK
jgi:hypothetical protein